MRISVIIPAINEQRGVGRAVEHALRAGADQVLCVDGGSSDQTRKIARQAGATVVRTAAGRALQQRAGAARAEGDVLVFVHADNWLGTETLHQIRELQIPPQAIWYGAFEQAIDARGLAYRGLEWGNALRVRWFGLPYGDQAIFMSRWTWEHSGGFPEVPLLEELILCRRLRREAKPLLLPGPVHVDARRWQQRGVLRQTLRNWRILLGYAAGQSPERLARLYHRHDRGPSPTNQSTT